MTLKSYCWTNRLTTSIARRGRSSTTESNVRMRRSWQSATTSRCLICYIRLLCTDRSGYPALRRELCFLSCTAGHRGASFVRADRSGTDRLTRSLPTRLRKFANERGRRAAQGERTKSKAGVARIVQNARGSQAQNSASRLRNRHTGIIEETRQRLADLRERQIRHSLLKLDFDDADLHTGKLLIRAKGVNFGYKRDVPLWPQPFDLEIRSGERIRITGDNGSGKTTLVRLLLGELVPTAGSVERTDCSVVFLDQEYRALDNSLSVTEMAERCNTHHLADHELKIRLARALFHTRRGTSSVVR